VRLSRRRVRPSDARALFQTVVRTAGIEEATRRFLLFFVVPLWLAAGLADWDRHRRTQIEHTAGTRESLIHVLMMTEAGVPSLLGLFLDVNAGVLLIAWAALVVHEATAIWDVAYAEARRLVTPTEQHIHSFLEVVPLMAVSFLTVLHWDQARALLSGDRAAARFALLPKRQPLSPTYVAGLLVALGACMVVPYAEEFWRCWRVDHSLAARPAPPRPATPTLQMPG